MEVEAVSISRQEAELFSALDYMSSVTPEQRLNVTTVKVRQETQSAKSFLRSWVGCPKQLVMVSGVWREAVV